MPQLTARDVTFLKLHSAVLCIECEQISYNNTDHCLACGSQAVLSLSRVLGGSLRQEPTTRVLDLQTLHGSVMTGLSRPPSCDLSVPVAASTGVFDLDVAMNTVVQQACSHTDASSAALALYRDGSMVCTARVGALAPDLGTEVRVEAGLTGMSVRTGKTLYCCDTASDERVDARTCRDWGVQSLVAAPLAHLNTVIGVLEVLSAKAYSFDDSDIAAVQLFANLMVLGVLQSRAGGHSRGRDHAQRLLS